MIDVAGRLVGQGLPCFVIAEAGVNHNGDMALAKKLIDAAAEAGADAVKFQTFNAARLASPSAPKAGYQVAGTGADQSQLEMLRQLELSADDHHQLQQYAMGKDILFLSSPFDEESADMLSGLGVPLLKLGSGEITNIPFLRHVGRMGLPVILSTGMSYLSEVDEAVRTLAEAGCSDIILLHCVSNYPAAPEDTNLAAMVAMAAAFQLEVGYSDHTLGDAVGTAAVALGACVIEKHLTIDKELPGPDHKASADPEEFNAFVAKLRTVERSIGDGIKVPAPSEHETREVARRSLAVSQDLAAGDVFSAMNVSSYRPGTGLSPTLIDSVLGRKANRALTAGELLTWEDMR